MPSESRSPDRHPLAPVLSGDAPAGHSPSPRDAGQRAPLPFAEFVALVASLMALGALGVDAMLPALPAIGRDLGLADPNASQFVIGIYLLGLGVGQLIHGPASDHWGRRPVMLSALAVYLVANLLAAAANGFVLLLAVRFVGAVAVAATRAVTVAIVRDCYAGRPMARVMSLASMIFMIAPTLAPSLGQAVLLVGSWRLIFFVIAALTVVVSVWFHRRLPETLHRLDQHGFSFAQTRRAVAQTLGDRWSLGYMLAATAMQAALFGYITSVQQIVATTFARPELLTAVFAVAAAGMAIANLGNARLVLRVGSRILSQSALVTMIAVAAFALLLDRGGGDTLTRFVLCQLLVSGCFSLANANFSALAMTNMGGIAGTASSVQGFVTVTGGALVGTLIGQSYRGTAVPLHLGYLVAGSIALAIVAVAERGRLFRPG